MIYNSLEELKNMPDEFWQTPGQILKVHDDRGIKPENIEFLSRPTEHVDSIELGEKIAAKLIKTLDKLNGHKRKGLALTANQIGIPASVFITNINGILYFINPDILDFSTKQIPFNESCLSIPNKQAQIQRHVKIKIKADNLEEPIWFGVDTISNDKDYGQLLEAITIQHEFNHTHGLLMTDLADTLEPIVNENKIGRNEKIDILKDGKTQQIKYKHFDRYKKEGWTAANGST